MTILDTIVADKKIELEARKAAVPLSSLEKLAGVRRPRRFKTALAGHGISLIGELKQASPSRGVLRQSFNPVDLARAYEQGGAAAISVLTEVKNFRGNLDYLNLVRREVSLPLLRKDFIFDPYQIYESAAFGADAVLLIAAILSAEQLKELLALGHSLGLDCLVETHNEAEVRTAVKSEAQIIGINNRDLKTFVVDMDTTRKLRRFVPCDRIVVSESGIKGRAEMEKLAYWAVDAALVGEALVTASDISLRLREMVA